MPIWQQPGDDTLHSGHLLMLPISLLLKKISMHKWL